MNKNSNSFELVKYQKHKATFEEVIIVFTLAAVVGYFIETGYVFLNCGKIVKRGMLLGPYCPIYGFGALILYYCFYDMKRNKENIPIIFLMSSLLMGAFELMCGLGFKHILNIEMWNYSDKFLNILNYTTVPILIGWGILGTIYVFFVHPLILKVVNGLPKNIMKRLSIVIICLFVCDLLISTRRINLDPNILEKLVNPQNATIQLKEEFISLNSSLFFSPTLLMK